MLRWRTPCHSRYGPGPRALDEGWTACGDTECQVHPVTHSKGAMMDFVCEKFPETCGPVVLDSIPLLPGMQRSEVPATTRCLRRYYRSYRTSVDESRSFPAKVNSDLVQHLTVHGDPQVSLPQGEMMLLEKALLTSQDTENFLFWLMGTFFSLTLSDEGPSAHGPMLHQLKHRIQRAVMDQARIMAFALANTRVVRRESYLSHLQHWFISVSKPQLCHSDMDSDLLFNSANVEKAIGQAQQAALVLLTKAMAKVLIKAKPRLGTPLVEKHPCPSTYAESCPYPTQQWFSKPLFHPCTSHDSGHPSSRQSKNQTFLQLLRLEAALPDVCPPGRT
ncbi:hypothetical protein E2C01_044203 [Portunus trituberculatus]|uniref:Uncharacterized protein n=1 Tax=Portunus trituberculatus TaxID=210409 RepID=A0A5B7FYF8_PORTR|nr:hypothetical protein [Portunus trituberculatus]